MMELGHERLDESLAFVRPDATWIPRPGEDPVRGHEEIRAYIAAELRRLGAAVPDALPAMLFEQDRVVLVLGELRIPHKLKARPYTELQPIAWVYEFEGELIARAETFDRWEAARSAADVPVGTPPTRKLRDVSPF